MACLLAMAHPLHSFSGMKDHHIRHHLVNADNWLGFSLPQVDDLFGTNPDIKEFRKQEAER